MSKKRKARTPIQWKPTLVVEVPPPPPRLNPDAPSEVIRLSNGKEMLRHTRYCSKTHEHYELKVKNLGDLLALADYYEEEFLEDKTCNINLRAIAHMAPHLYELDQMIGMDRVKEQVMSLVLFFLQKLDNVNQDMLHTAVYGSPGVGKTRLIHILAGIMSSLGITKGSRVTFVRRADLIGQYLGQTAAKTRKALEEATPGILVLDEAYSLGDTEQRDSYSRECIDVINQHLSECKRNLVCIIAGYKEDLERRFFRTNAGLRRRFAFHFEMEDYNAPQLRQIFLQNLERSEWFLTDGAAPLSFFENNLCHFPHMGGDMELLFAKMKFEHGRRVFSRPLHEHRRLTKEDVEAGLASFLENRTEKKNDAPPPMMYT